MFASLIQLRKKASTSVVQRAVVLSLYTYKGRVLTSRLSATYESISIYYPYGFGWAVA